MKLNTGAKVWLWIWFVLAILSCIGCVITMLLGGEMIIELLSIANNIVMLIGIILLLFRQKKVGFYLICAMAAVNIIVNIISGYGIIVSLCGAIGPIITYLFLRKQWNELG